MAFRGIDRVASLPYMHGVHGGLAAQRAPNHPDVPQTWTVQNCTDHDTDSLRDIVENPNNAKSGDIVDLSQLPMFCNTTDSTITLTTGEITINQDKLHLVGPSQGIGSVAISGGGDGRVLKFEGMGSLYLYALSIEDGFATGAGDVGGGCLESQGGGSLYLRRTTVSGCTAYSINGYAKGGGIYSAHDVTLVLSNVAENQAVAPHKRGLGGGILAANVFASYSSISANVALDGANGAFGSFGGGVYANQSFTARGSVIDNNVAAFGGGIKAFVTATIVNSTISANQSDQDYSAIVFQGDSLTISNSTIAFNHSDSTFAGPTGAVCFEGISANSVLNLHSSIVADNSATDLNAPVDLFMVGMGMLAGEDNLVIASNIAPPAGVVTVTADPKLGPLQFNGGWTRTHALLPGSPAIGVGNRNGLPPWITVDQRGPGYPRSTGPNATTDMGAFEFDTIFSGGFDFN